MCNIWLQLVCGFLGDALNRQNMRALDQRSNNNLDLLYSQIFKCSLRQQNLLKISMKSGPEIIKLFSCSSQLSMKFFLLINVKMPTIVGILTFMKRKNSTISLTELKKC